MRHREHSKLIYFLSGLDPESRALFRDYLHSPVFNTKEEPRLLYDFILRGALQPPISEINDVAAAAYVWPDGKGDVAKLQKIKSSLMNLALGYLQFRNWRSRPEVAEGALLEELNRMDEESYFELYYKKAKAELLAQRQMDLRAYAGLLDLEVQFQVHRQKHSIRSGDTPIEETLAAMKRLVASHAFKFAVITLNQGSIFGAVEIPAWLDSTVRQYVAADFVGEPLLEIYYLLYRTLLPEATHEELLKLKDRVLAHAQACNPQEAYELYTGAINHVLRFSKRTGLQLLGVLFELYQSMVEVHALKMGAGLDAAHLKNVVLIGCRLGKLDWVAELLALVPKLLRGEGEQVEGMLDYNQGVFHFYSGDFAATVRCMNRVMSEAKDIFVSYDARLYLLMCFFETGDSMGMEALVHSFRLFIERSDRVSATHKENYLDFIRVFRRLLATPPNDQIRLQRLKAEIDALKLGAGKAWMLQKLGPVSE